jgi:formiminotetrahydrofolate cyclodeaminase
VELIADQSIAEFAEQLAARRPTPGGGAACAMVAGLAAALAEMAAGYCDQRSLDLGSEDLLDRLRQARRRAFDLADADSAAYGAYRAARADTSTGGRKAREAALRQAAAVPAELAFLTQQIAETSAQLFHEGNANLRTDAFAAAVLAAAIAEASAQFVVGNLGDSAGDPLVVRALESVMGAKEAAQTVRGRQTDVQKGAG